MILTYKLSFYFGLSLFFSGLVSEEAKKRGHAVCFYQSAVDRLNEAWKTAEKISSDKTSMFKDVHQFASDVFNGKFKATKRDNDSVYFEKVPILSSLPAVQGVTVAKSQFFDCHDPDVSGVDIFQKLVPLVKFFVETKRKNVHSFFRTLISLHRSTAKKKRNYYAKSSN